MTKRQMTVSVIIPVHNCAEYLGDALKSVFAQTYAAHQVLVVNDGSTDDTEVALRPWLPRIEYWRQENLGKPSATNVALERSTGDLIAFLDADDLWEAQKLARQVQFFEAEPSLDVCFTNYTTFGLPVEPPNAFESAPEGFWCLAKRALDGGRYLLDRDSLVTNFLPPSPIPCRMTTVMARRRCFDGVGIFDPTLISCQDLQMFSRLARYYNFGFLVEPLARRRVRAASLSHSLSEQERTAYQLQVLETIGNWIQLSARERRGVKSKIAALTLGLGYRCYTRGDFRTARRHLRRALHARPSLRLLYYFVLACLPSEMLRGLRKLKHGIAEWAG